MELILLAISASILERSGSGVAMFDPECEGIMTHRNVGNCSYEKHIGHDASKRRELLMQEIAWHPRTRECSFWYLTMILHWHNPSGHTMALGSAQALAEIRKGKSIPLQALTGPEGSRRLRLPDFKTIGTWRWQGCQPNPPAAFTPRKYFWYSFLSQSQGHSAAGRIMSTKN
jgi:hypothetical protein